MFGEGTSAFLIAGVIERFEVEVVRIPGQLASWPGSALRPAASIPAIAQASSRSELSPEMPTAPMMSPVVPENSIR
jgi:hypothetical protein